MKVGEYARYKYEDITYIGKITFISEVMLGLDETLAIDIDNCIEEVYKRDILKSSPNIIDLIEEHDILKVNDFKNVYTIYEVEMFRNPYTNEKYLGIRDHLDKRPKRLYEIPLLNLSIVTHEQFERIQYKVESEVN